MFPGVLLGLLLPRLLCFLQGCALSFPSSSCLVQGCALSRHLSYDPSAEQCVPSHPFLLRSRSLPLPLRLASAVSPGRTVSLCVHFDSYKHVLTKVASDNSAL